MKSGGKWIIFILVVVAIVAVFLTFFYTPRCDDLRCWDYKVSKCSRASYINDAPDIVWYYKVSGKENGKCALYVEVMQIKKGLTSTQVLEGKGMTCYLPIGTIVKPESDLNLCTGPLKEEMQGLIIQKVYQYIVQNVGNIGRDLFSIEGVNNNFNFNNSISSGNSSS